MISPSANFKELAAEEAPSPRSVEELSAYIQSLVRREHDYNTCVPALSLATVAAFNYVASALGVTGFQASCADLDIIRRVRHIKGPWMIIKAEDALFSSGSPIAKAREAVERWQDWLAKEAQDRLRAGGISHPSVIEHWANLAYPFRGAEWQEAIEKAEFLRNELTEDFIGIPENAEKLKRYGINQVYLGSQKGCLLAEECRDGGSCRFNMPVSLRFLRRINDIEVEWSVDAELPDSNGQPIYRFDYEKLAELSAGAVNLMVKAAICTYVVKARLAQEKQLGAMSGWYTTLPFMPDSECNIKDCSQQATKGLAVCIPAKGMPVAEHDPIRVVIGLLLCEKHFAEAKAQDFFDADPRLEQTVRLMAHGRAEPDFASAFISEATAQEWRLLTGGAQSC